MIAPVAPRTATVLGVSLVIALCVLTPLALWTLLPDVKQWGLELPTVAVMALAGGRLAWLVGARRIRPFEVVAWIYVYVFLGVAPLVQLRSVTSPATTPEIDTAHVPDGFWIVLVGALALLVGTVVQPHLKLHLPAARSVRARSLMILFCLSATAELLVIQRMGGPAGLLRTRVERAAESRGAGGAPTDVILFGLATMGLLVVTVGGIQLWRQHRRDRSARWWHPWLPLMSGLMLFTLVNPVASPRYVVGVCLMGVATALGLQSKLWRFRLVSVGLLASLVLVFPLMDSFRVSLSAGVEEVDPLRALSAPDFDSFAQIVNTRQYVEDLGHTDGRQLAGAVLFVVPRMLWPDKPVDTGIELARFRDYRVENLSAPLWAEFFIDGGWLLLVVGMLATGVLVASLDSRAEIERERWGMPGVIGSVLPLYFLLILRGSLLQSMANLMVFVVCSLVVTRAIPPLSKETS